MEQITVTELASLAPSALIDVREPDEYAGGHAPGAVNIPLGDIQSRMSEIPSTGNVYLICQSGRRSAHAADVLTGHGMTAINVEGGTTAWVEAGFPTEPASR